MSLTPGTRIGPYEVTAQIGVGGMGEVYRVSDTKLKREVALKILPASFATDTDRLARFQREAEVLASLNHPNIAAIYGVEESDGLKALVLELVEGLTLADRIAEGPIPLDEALPIAKQIADALEAAHEQGIIHRDVKPANIKLRPDGSVKVLDFGLAKALEPALAQTEVTVAPTMASPGMITGLGTLLGTPAYMSPEQARGKPVDKRSDIWAFGCVLFEMVTGRRAFDGDSGPDMLARIIEREPAFSALPPGTPPSIVRLLRRALAKDRRMRLPDIAMARLEIADAMSGQEVTPVTAPEQRHARWPRALPWVVAGLATAGAIGTVWAGRRPADAVGVQAVRLTENLPPGVSLYLGVSPSFAVSRDGTQIAYVGVAGGQRDVYVRRMDEPEAMVIPAAAGGFAIFSCFFNWDGTAVGFISAGGILGKVTLADRRTVTLVERGVERRGATWGPDDRITFTRGDALWQIAASESSPKPTPLTTIDGDHHEVQHGWPSAVDGGRRILFTVLTDRPRDPASVWALSVATGKRNVLEEAASFPLYAASGHLLFFRNGAVLARPFDLERLQALGAAVPVLDKVGTDNAGQPLVAMSSTGTLIHASPVRNRLVWVSRKGLEQRVSNMPRAYEFPHLTPNGTSIIVAAGGDLLVESTERHSLGYLASSDATKNFLTLTPNGAQVVFRTPRGLRVASGERDHESQAIPGTQADDFPTSISRDGTLAFNRLSSNTSSDVYFVSLRGGEPHPVLNASRVYEGGLQFEPRDGNLVAFVSNEIAHMEVYVARTSDLATRTPVSGPQGGTQPLWARNGKELFYRRGNEMRVVTVTLAGDTVKLSDDRPLFEGDYAFGSGLTTANYDVDLASQRFLMVKDEAGSGRLNVVLNWFTELRRLAPLTGR